MEITLVEGDFGQEVTTQLCDRDGPLPVAGRPVTFHAGSVSVSTTGAANGFVTFVVPAELTEDVGVRRARWVIDWNGHDLPIPDQPCLVTVAASSSSDVFILAESGAPLYAESGAPLYME